MFFRKAPRMDLREGAVGRSDFVKAHDIWTAEDREAAQRTLALIKEKNVDFNNIPHFAKFYTVQIFKANWTSSYALNANCLTIE